MKFLVVLPLIFLSSFSCMAQDSEQFRACNEKAKSQAEMNGCANEEEKRTDTELNNVYRTLRPRTRPAYLQTRFFDGCVTFPRSVTIPRQSGLQGMPAGGKFSPTARKRRSAGYR